MRLRDLWRRDNPRYVARALNWRPLLGVETGMVDDTRPDQPTSFPHEGPGFEFVTTYSTAKRIARKANRLDRKANRVQNGGSWRWAESEDYETMDYLREDI